MANQGVTTLQDPVQISPQFYKVLLDNEFVRVLEVKLPPGARSEMHSHPDYVIYALSDGAVRFTSSDGRGQDTMMYAGEASFRQAESHAAENVGSGDIGVLNLELKLPARAGARRSIPGPDLPDVAPQYVQTLIENDRCRLLDIRFGAGTTLPMHASPDQVVYPLADGKVMLRHADGTSHDLTVERGKPFFIKGMICSVENIGGTEMHVVKLDLM